MKLFARAAMLDAVPKSMALVHFMVGLPAVIAIMIATMLARIRLAACDGELRCGEYGRHSDNNPQRKVFSFFFAVMHSASDQRELS